MKKSKILKLFIFSILILWSISLVVGYKSMYQDFEGSTHVGCHGGTNPKNPFSYIEIISTSGTRLEPIKTTIITVQVKNFTEAADENIVVGFIIGNLERGNNSLFTLNTTSYEDVAIDPSNNTCCPPGWNGPTARTASANLFRDVNGDGKLCFKNLPGNGNGNNRGPVDHRNWKDNNHPCD